MATILLSAAGAAIGGSVGGSVLGLSMTAVGRFAGASLGRVLDQRLMGQGSETVETGQMDRFRLSGSGEGAPIAQVYGRMRVGGHVIWATEFLETVTTRGGGGGKGAPRQPKVREYSYSVSLALALCEGEIAGVNRLWADGVEVPLRDLHMRVYRGTDDQLPDPKIEAVEGAGSVPAYRGTAYVVIEDLDLSQFGNRIPQFSFEVARPDLSASGLPSMMKGVAMIPGSGEYALATEPVFMNYDDPGSLVSFSKGAAIANVNTPSEEPDFLTSLRQLKDEAPGCGAISFVVSWFGDDLRCGECTIRPKVEQAQFDGKSMPWLVSGLTRQDAQLIPRENDRPVYGGTHSDQSVIQAIRKSNEDGFEVLFYPFILMDQLAGSGLPDPWSPGSEQPKLPWRGRITTSLAPGQDNTPDETAAADAEVAAFFGVAEASDFDVSNGEVRYSGPDEWGYRRFILHQAALCAAAGGVASFCVGSEMRSLTQIRGANGFPAVDALIALTAECRALLGPDVKIGYAADWSEYFGYHPQDGSGDVHFHLDALWADPNIDFIGIDNYMPLSDWRDGSDHLDAQWETIYNIDYLRAGIEGGEGYDWFYASPEARDAQLRTPITDGTYGEPWVFRYKDIRNWWGQRHYDRVGGVRSQTPTAWVPQSKPVWFTELGCAAIDKGTNQPNKFLDPKSSESALPHYSNALRDELIQHEYLRAMYGYWGESQNNPVSELYGGPMIDMDYGFVWAWDARPYPWFPGNEALWTDGGNYRRGHWLNGRIGGRPLASVVSEICARVGLTLIDTSGLHGFVRGYLVPDVSDARRALQPLMLAYGFDAIERDGVLVFRMRSGLHETELDIADIAMLDGEEGDLIETRSGEAEMAGRVRVGFVVADADHQAATEEAVLPDDDTHAVAQTDLALALTRAEARQTAERWLSEARVARDTMRFALPPSKMALGAGDIVRLHTGSGPVLARIDRVDVTDRQDVEAVRIEPDVYAPSEFSEEGAVLRPFTPAVPVTPIFLDLPLMRGDEVEHAPHLALKATPWPGSVALYDAPSDEDYTLNGLFAAQSILGVTETPLLAACAGRIDRGEPLQVRLVSGTLQSVTDTALLSGGNAMAIGDGSPGNWEIFQFRDATLLSDDRWLLSHRLRGQAGSDGIMPQSWPAGSVIVALDGAPEQIALAANQRRIARHYRIGPARRPLDDTSYVHQTHAFDGNGLRPYSPVHLRRQVTQDGSVFSWVRRTRIDGDGWDAFEVPLGEDSEAYLVRVLQNDAVVREAQVGSTAWTYEAGLQVIDDLSGPYQVAVAQISARYGPGPFARISMG